MLTVSDENAAISFYKAAFGATVGWYMSPTGQLIAALSIDGTLFFLSREVPAAGRRGSTGPSVVPVKIQLFVDDPVAAHRKAVDAGAVEREPVQGYEGGATQSRAVKRMVQGTLVDPFGHVWVIGKILEQ